MEPLNRYVIAKYSIAYDKPIIGPLNCYVISPRILFLLLKLLLNYMIGNERMLPIPAPVKFNVVVSGKGSKRFAFLFLTLFSTETEIRRVRHSLYLLISPFRTHQRTNDKKGYRICMTCSRNSVTRVPT